MRIDSCFSFETRFARYASKRLAKAVGAEPVPERPRARRAKQSRGKAKAAAPEVTSPMDEAGAEPVPVGPSRAKRAKASRATVTRPAGEDVAVGAEPVAEAERPSRAGRAKGKAKAAGKSDPKPKG